MDSSPDTDDLVFRYLERVDAGEAATRVLDELCRAFPQRAEALVRGVELLRRTRLHPPDRRAELADPVGRIGPFRLERKLGEGGMGVVYAAWQDAPRRRVALKLIRPDQLHFEGTRERFEREIESVARLSHPCIAAVHEIGEHDGVPWFTQELVTGAPLADLLAALPVHSIESIRAEDAREVLEQLLDAQGERLDAGAWNESFFRGTWVELALRLARSVSDALQHAHERGVLHRDVKPSNVLVTPDGRAVLVDFGLASVEGVGRITRTGTQLGSVHYMSPEQIRGDAAALGPRSDVYSLGVTLYELLTLRTPYTSQSLERLRGLILRGDAPPARRLNPAVSRDASTVCAKAMDPSPERRYESAAALAADLAATLEHRPVAARAAGPLLRATRWCQRHPALAVALAAGFLLVVVAPLAFALQRSRAADDLADLNRELEAALEVSEDHLESATQAIERVMRWTADEGLDEVPGMLELRARVIAEALDVFEGLRARRPGDHRLALQQGVLLRTQGAILNDLRRTREAEASFRAAEAVLETFRSEGEEEARRMEELARCLHAHGRALENVGRYDEALPRYRAAHATLGELSAEAPRARGLRRDLALSAVSVADMLLEREGWTAEAEALLEEALTLLDELTASADAPVEALSAHATALAVRGERHVARVEFAAAEEAFARAVQTAERARARAPRDRVARWNLHHFLTRRAWAAERLDRPVEHVEAWLRRALAIADELCAENPGVPEYRDDRSAVRGQLADLQRKRGDHRGAYAVLLEVAREALARAEAEPGAPDLWYNAAIHETNLANVALVDEERGEERLELVERHCDRAAQLLERGSSGRTPPRAVREVWLFVWASRGAVAYDREDVEGVVEALEALEGLALDGPLARFHEAVLWQRLASLEDDAASAEEALLALERAVDAGFSDSRMLRDSGVLADLAASGHLEPARLEALRARLDASAASE